MLADMLHPPEIDEEDTHALSDSMDKDRDRSEPRPES
jgi:hypothetical protein